MDHHNRPQTQKSYPNPTQRTRHQVNLPETAPSPSPPGCFSGLPELWGAWAPMSPILLTDRFSSVSVLFTFRASAMACGSEGQRTRRSTGAGAKEARALGSYGMHLLLWVGWELDERGTRGDGINTPDGVSRKSPLNWLMSTIGEFSGMITPGFVQVLIG